MSQQPNWGPQPGSQPGYTNVQPVQFQQPAPQPGPMSAGPAPWEVAPAAVGGGGAQPAMHQLVGRLMLWRPLSIQDNIPSKFVDQTTGKPRMTKRVICDLYVLDGPSIDSKINRTDGTVTPLTAMTAPFYLPGKFVSNTVLVDQLTPAITSGAWLLGRLEVGQARGGMPPYKISLEVTADDTARAQQIWPHLDQIKAQMVQQAPAPAPVQQQAPVPQPGYGQPQPAQWPPAQPVQPQQAWPPAAPAAPPWGQQA